MFWTRIIIGLDLIFDGTKDSPILNFKQESTFKTSSLPLYDKLFDSLLSFDLVCIIRGILNIHHACWGECILSTYSQLDIRVLCWVNNRRRHSSRLSVRCERDEVHKNIHTLMWELREKVETFSFPSSWNWFKPAAVDSQEVCETQKTCETWHACMGYFRLFMLASWDKFLMFRTISR